MLLALCSAEGSAAELLLLLFSIVCFSAIKSRKYSTVFSSHIPLLMAFFEEEPLFDPAPTAGAEPGVGEVAADGDVITQAAAGATAASTASTAAAVTGALTGTPPMCNSSAPVMVTLFI